MLLYDSALENKVFWFKSAVIDVGEADLRRSVAVDICSISKMAQESDYANKGVSDLGKPAFVASQGDNVTIR